MAAALFLCQPAWADEVRPEDLVKALNQYLSAFDHCSLRARERSYPLTAGPTYPPGYLYRETTIERWRDHGRRRDVAVTTVRPVRNGRLQEGKSKSEYLWSEGKVVMVEVDPKSGQPLGVLTGRDEGGKDYRMRNADSLLLTDGRFWLPPHSLSDLLDRAKLSAARGRLADRDVWVLEAKGELGDFTVWLDPGRGMLPLRVLDRKAGHHKNQNGVRLDVAPEAEGGPCHQATMDVTATKVEVAQGRPLVTEYEVLRESITGESRRRYAEKVAVRLSDINLSPRFSANTFIASTPIPNGYNVTVEGEEMIRHEWRDGEVVKSVNQRALASMGGHWFSRGSMLTRGVVLLATLTVVVACCLLWYRRRTGA